MGWIPEPYPNFEKSLISGQFVKKLPLSAGRQTIPAVLTYFCYDKFNENSTKI
jgi:hypothetical protein